MLQTCAVWLQPPVNKFMLLTGGGLTIWCMSMHDTNDEVTCRICCLPATLLSTMFMWPHCWNNHLCALTAAILEDWQFPRGQLRQYQPHTIELDLQQYNLTSIWHRSGCKTIQNGVNLWRQLRCAKNTQPDDNGGHVITAQTVVRHSNHQLLYTTCS